MLCGERHTVASSCEGEVSAGPPPAVPSPFIEDGLVYCTTEGVAGTMRGEEGTVRGVCNGRLWVEWERTGSCSSLALEAASDSPMDATCTLDTDRRVQVKVIRLCGGRSAGLHATVLNDQKELDVPYAALSFSCAPVVPSSPLTILARRHAGARPCDDVQGTALTFSGKRRRAVHYDGSALRVGDPVQTTFRIGVQPGRIVPVDVGHAGGRVKTLRVHERTHISEGSGSLSFKALLAKRLEANQPEWWVDACKAAYAPYEASAEAVGGEPFVIKAPPAGLLNVFRGQEAQASDVETPTNGDWVHGQVVTLRSAAGDGKGDGTLWLTLAEVRSVLGPAAWERANKAILACQRAAKNTSSSRGSD